MWTFEFKASNIDLYWEKFSMFQCHKPFGINVPDNFYTNCIDTVTYDEDIVIEIVRWWEIINI